MAVARAQATAATTAAVLTITVLAALHLRPVHPVARLSLSAGGQSFWDSESNLWRRATARAPVRSIAAAGVAIGDQHPAAPEHAARLGHSATAPRTAPAAAAAAAHDYKGVNLNKVYRKAYDAAFKAAYGGTFKTALGKAEQKLFQEVQKGREARRELDALERDRQLAALKAKRGRLRSKTPLPALNSPLSPASGWASAVVGAGNEAEKDKQEPDADSVTGEERVAPLGRESHTRTGPEITGRKDTFGPLERHCSTGNCKPLEEAGVNVDAWRGLMFDRIQRTVPLPQFDPSEDPVTKRAMAQRMGRFARYNAGRKDEVVRWGGAAENDPLSDPTAQRLEKHGVNTRAGFWGKGFRRALPLPVFDDTQYDYVAGRGKSPYVSAADRMQLDRDSDSKLEDAGVQVNRLPGAFASKGFASVDGVPDRMLATESLPAFRKDGVARQEEPLSFVLSDQAAALMNTPQALETPDGVEAEESPVTETEGDLTRAGVNVDAWPDKLGHLWDSSVPSTGAKHVLLAHGVLPRGTRQKTP